MYLYVFCYLFGYLFNKFMLLLRYVFMIKNVLDFLFNLRFCNLLMFKRKDDEL